MTNTMPDIDIQDTEDFTEIERALIDEEDEQRRKRVKTEKAAAPEYSTVCDTKLLYNGEGKRFLDVNGETVCWQDGDVHIIPRWLAEAQVRQRPGFSIVGEGVKKAAAAVSTFDSEATLPAAKDLAATCRDRNVPEDIQNQTMQLLSTAKRNRTKAARERFWTYYNRILQKVYPGIDPDENYDHTPDETDEMLDETGKAIATAAEATEAEESGEEEILSDEGEGVPYEEAIEAALNPKDKRTIVRAGELMQ